MNRAFRWIIAALALLANWAGAVDKGIVVEAIRAADKLGVNRHALIIGINEYADTKIPKLKFAETDAQSLYQTLTDPQVGGFKPENTTLLLGKQATTREIKKALSGLRGVGADDLVVIYFSGHGAKQRGETCWVTQDAELNYLADTALTNDQIEKYLNGIPSKRLVVLLDACYAADTVINQKALLDVDTLAKAFTGAGRVTIASAGGGQESIEATDLKQGVFTYFLVQALRGAADQPPYGNLDGVQTLSEIWSYVSDKVTQEARKRQGIQVPTKHSLAETQTDKFLLTINASWLANLQRQQQAALSQVRARVDALKKFLGEDKLTADQFTEGRRVLEALEQDLDEADRQRRKIYGDLAEGRLVSDYLQAALDKVETPAQRQARVEREAERRMQRDKSARITALFATAKANDSKASGKTALAALDELLRLDPGNGEAILLRGKIQGYYSKQGDTKLNTVGMTLVYIPPGEFMMGSTKEEQEWAKGPEGQASAAVDFSDEGPEPRLTRVKDGFWMGRTEVTVGQFRRFVDDTGYQTDAEKKGEAFAFDWDKSAWGVVKGASWREPQYGFAVRDEHPVACVSWNDAVAFCAWLTKKEQAAGRLTDGEVYRLPTEAEWEYACRGDRQGTKFWWGNSTEDGKGRLNAASDDKLGHKLPNTTWNPKFPWSDGYAWVAPVDSFGQRGRNSFGLADMLGNVWEWCMDGYDKAGAHEDVYTADTARRVLRGGSFNLEPGFCRCALRYRLYPDYTNSDNGFRVVVGSAR
jgi:formylglycine-generating enzyme required for sulfatase activity